MVDLLKKTKRIEILFIPVLCLVQYVQLQYSALPALNFITGPGFIYIGINILVILSIHLLLTILFGTWYFAYIFTCIFFTVWSIVNHFTILYHGGPLVISELANIRTALHVAGNYTYYPDKVIWYVLLAAIFEILVFFLYKFLAKNTNRLVKKERFCFGILMVIVMIILKFCLIGKSALKPQNTVTWSWKASVNEYGFLSYVIEDAQKALHPYKIKAPEGYSAEKIFLDPKETDKKSGDYPDIILILNESFYDLREYTDIHSDTDFLKDLYDIDDALYGHAVVPDIGGGTNDSEFELLTSCSMYLLDNNAPFNYLDLSKVDAQIVGYLKRLGYTTAGMHCEAPSNYSRNKVYPDLSFDKVLLGEDDFQYKRSYGNRL